MHVEDEGMHWGCLRGVGGGTEDVLGGLEGACNEGSDPRPLMPFGA